MHALVTIEVSDCSSKKLEIFNEFLKRRKWTKLDGFSNVWIVLYKDTVTFWGVRSSIKAELAAAQNESQISDIKYVFQVNAGYDFFVSTWDWKNEKSI
ncbi:hypothetical protein [Geofilum rubicundum]|uniref:Uncharacterized protein n=1 Tax=Geofilum rubicundum JCM 15548 TaxID=1236989 RepID=A0A0E9LXS4_9BACT|nr:hypothetical protein [Geofilum rubicundum]GAO29921.1 hypothetical protein JCM15548_12156 [Geofilum rubicundum JCM 15548]